LLCRLLLLLRLSCDSLAHVFLFLLLLLDDLERALVVSGFIIVNFVIVFMVDLSIILILPTSTLIISF
jgi:hypothetical protein